ncbi:MAG: hypothetical protein H0W48_00465 [Methylibium sp.]|nr:hypothetical protein [Methylibium sp.]
MSTDDDVYLPLSPGQILARLVTSSGAASSWATPPAIGTGTPNSAAFTTLTASGTITGSSTVQGTRLISTIATGTAPLTVSSTTVVPNLNASQLLGATWAAPGAIGATTPSSGAFTTLTASGTITGSSGTLSNGLSVTAGTVTLGTANDQLIYGGTSLQVRRSDNTSAERQAIALARGSGAGNAGFITTTGDAANGCASLIFDLGATRLYTVTATAFTVASALSMTLARTTGTTLTVSSTDAAAIACSGGATFGAATTSRASIRIPHGTAPTSPVNGDMWSTTAGLFIRIDGVTKTVTLT